MDIGLDFVSGLLNFLKGRWTLAVLFPAGSPPQGRATDAVGKLARHFARIGFTQVAEFEPLCQYWFVEASGRSQRKSKEEVAAISVAFPRKQMPLEGLDKELHEVCRSASIDNSAEEFSIPKLERIRSLLAKGADLERSSALHVCAAAGDAESARELLERGAGVNLRDRHCSTPLHVAASLCGKRGMLGVVSLLLSYGAYLDAINQEGMTPLECARGARRQAMDFRKMKGVSKKGNGHLRQYEHCIMLLSSFVQQPERNSKGRVTEPC